MTDIVTEATGPPITWLFDGDFDAGLDRNTGLVVTAWGCNSVFEEEPTNQWVGVRMERIYTDMSVTVEAPPGTPLPDSFAVPTMQVVLPDNGHRLVTVLPNDMRLDPKTHRTNRGTYTGRFLPP